MKIITEWTTLESIVNGTLVAILDANASPALAMLNALRNTAAQREAIQAAATATLSNDDLEILNALISRFSKLARQRNKVVHWNWGTCLAIEDGLLLFPPQVSSAFALMAGMARRGQNYDLNPDTMGQILADRIGALSEQFILLHHLLSSPDVPRDQLRSELRTELGIAAG